MFSDRALYHGRKSRHLAESWNRGLTSSSWVVTSLLAKEGRILHYRNTNVSQLLISALAQLSPDTKKLENPFVIFIHVFPGYPTCLVQNTPTPSCNARCLVWKNVRFARKNSPEMLRASQRTTTIFWPPSSCFATVLAKRPSRWPFASIT